MKALCIGGCSEGTVREIPDDVHIYQVRDRVPLRIQFDPTHPISLIEPTPERISIYHVSALSIGSMSAGSVGMGLLIEHRMDAAQALQRLQALCSYFAYRRRNRVLDKQGLACCPFCKGAAYIEMTGAYVGDIYADRFFCGCHTCDYHLRPIARYEYIEDVGYKENRDARQKCIEQWNHQP